MITLANAVAKGDSILVLYIDDVDNSSLVRTGYLLLISDAFPEVVKIKKVIERVVEKREDGKYGEYVTVQTELVGNWHAADTPVDIKK